MTPPSKSPANPTSERAPEGPGTAGLRDLATTIEGCRACDRLVAWREHVAIEKRASFHAETYWGRPVSGFGDANARLLVLGLAPAAHGGNRTGRVFTGDRSGEWLFRALHRAGYANQPNSIDRTDGLALTDCYVTAAVRCAPPANKPTPAERDACQPFLEQELACLRRLRVVVALGQFAYDAAARVLPLDTKPKFGHLARTTAGNLHIVCSYHPSLQNTFTGKLTQPMFDEVFSLARSLSQTSHGEFGSLDP